jgi:hypothetical protein
MPTSATQLHKKYEVDVSFTIFMKQQKRCFTNINFELPHEVGVKLTAMPSSTQKMVCSFSFFLRAVPLPISSPSFAPPLSTPVLLPCPSTSSLCSDPGAPRRHSRGCHGKVHDPPCMALVAVEKKKQSPAASRRNKSPAASRRNESLASSEEDSRHPRVRGEHHLGALEVSRRPALAPSPFDFTLD